MLVRGEKTYLLLSREVLRIFRSKLPKRVQSEYRFQVHIVFTGMIQVLIGVPVYLLFSTSPFCQAFILVHSTATVTFDQVYFQYQSDWIRRLVSSEPRRRWSLENVSFHWESELVLLVGASSSGKSTALQLMSDAAMAPTHGCVLVSSPPIYMEAGKISRGRPKEEWTTRERLGERPNLLKAFQLTTAADKTSSQLSVSDHYKLRLAEVCIGAPDAPILLLDEWLDKEPTAIVTAVEAALQSFVDETNAIVVVVTHKVDRWTTRNRMELRSGKLVRS